MERHREAFSSFCQSPRWSPLRGAASWGGDLLLVSPGFLSRDEKPVGLARDVPIARGFLDLLHRLGARMIRPARSQWTSEEDAVLAKMASQGRSSAEIGKRLDRTRRSILGRANRLGISLQGINSGNRNAAKAHAVKPRATFIKAETPRPKRREPKQETKPVLLVVSNEQKLIEEYIAKNGVRRFAPGQATDRYSIQKFLEDRGYTLSGWQGKNKISGGRGRPRMMTWAQVIRFVDELRAAEGLPTFQRAG